MEQLIPFDKYILIKILVDDKTKGGLFIPDQEEKSELGEVVEIGKGLVSKNIEIGQKVILKKHSGNMVEFNGEKYRVCEEKDLMLKVISQ